jgi:hypothetical protein
MLFRRAAALIIAGLAVLQSNSKVALQLQVATAVYACLLAAQVWVRPYRDTHLNRLSTLGLLSVRKAQRTLGHRRSEMCRLRLLSIPSGFTCLLVSS